MNTMRIATPMGYSSRPPRKVWPVVLGMALLLGVGGGVLSVTCFGHDNAARSGEAEAHVAAPSPAGSGNAAGSGGGSDGDPGAVVVATTRPPPRAPTFSDPPTETASAAGGGSSATGGSAAGSPGTAGSADSAAIRGGPGRNAASSAGGATGPSTTAGSMAGAGASAGNPGAATASPAPVHTAHLTIESVPTGASVKGPHNAPLGKTPLVIEWPTSDAPVSFELRLGGYRAKQKQTVINGNTRLVIELERAPIRRAGPKPSSTGNGLMRPDE